MNEFPIDRLERLREIAKDMASRVHSGPGSKASDYLEGWAAEEIERLRAALIICGNMHENIRYVHNYEECAAELNRRARIAQTALANNQGN